MRKLVERVGGWHTAAEREAMRAQFRPGVDGIVVMEGCDVGHLGVDEESHRVVLRILAFLPEAQRRGLGAALVRDVVRRAHPQGKPLVLRLTEQNAGARHLYERLGFRTVGVADDPTRTRKVEMATEPAEMRSPRQRR